MGGRIILVVQNNQKLIAIVGPTGSGKSALALSLAEQFNGAIICADSRTIYRGMNIGTAKPSSDEQQRVMHYGLDLVEPGQSYSAAEFQAYTETKITEINIATKLPFLVGGSGLYIDSVLFGYKFRSPHDSDDYRRYADIEIIEMFQARYPEYVPKVDLNNRRRLEQILSRGPADTNDRKQLKYRVLILGLNPSRELLRKHIEHRTRAMLAAGLIEEVKQLRRHYGADCAQLQTIGYSQIGEYLDGAISAEVAKAKINTDSIALARRQMSWFKRNPRIHWLSETENPAELINDYLTHAGVQ